MSHISLFCLQRKNLLNGKAKKCSPFYKLQTAFLSSKLQILKRKSCLSTASAISAILIYLSLWFPALVLPLYSLIFHIPLSQIKCLLFNYHDISLLKTCSEMHAYQSDCWNLQTAAKLPLNAILNKFSEKSDDFKIV